jgi:large subunit ribosomal protein L6
MSRIGKKPINVPEKVEVNIQGTLVTAKGPKGTNSCTVSDKVILTQDGKNITVKPKDQSEDSFSQWGTARTLVGNLVTGVSSGFIESLEFNGVGYKANVSGAILQLSLGYSHVIDFPLPVGVSAKVVKNQIDIEGVSKEQVGQVAAKVRMLRPPEPYKGKGLKYLSETIKRKAGKAGGKGK